MHPVPSSGQPPPNSTTLASKGTTKAGLTFLAPDSPDTGCDTWKEFSDSHKVHKETTSFVLQHQGSVFTKDRVSLETVLPIYDPTSFYITVFLRLSPSTNLT